MNTLHVTSLCVALLISSGLYGQSISQSVVGLAGGLDRTPSGLTVSWTLGEPIVDPIRQGDALLTQGFQQPDFQLSTGYVDPSFNHAFSIYPNPTAGHLYLRTAYPKSIEYRLVSSLGQVATEGAWQQEKRLDLRRLSAGVYALYLLVDGRMIRSELISIQ